MPSQIGSASLNDIAVRYLIQPLPLDGTTMAAIELPTGSGGQWSAAGTAEQISGWGWTSPRGWDPTTLQWSSAGHAWIPVPG